MSAQEVLTALNYSSVHPPSDTYFLSAPSVSLSHTSPPHPPVPHTHTGIRIHTVLSLLRLVTHTLVSGAIKVLSANSLFQKLSHVARGVSLPVVTLWAPGTRTSHYFHGKGQTLCHLTPKWSWVELPWDNDQRSVFCFASRAVRMDLRKTGRFPICLWAPFGHSGFQTGRFR